MKQSYKSLFNKALNGGKRCSNIFYRFFLRILGVLFIFSLIGATSYHVSQFDFKRNSDCHVYIFAHYSEANLPEFEEQFEKHKEEHPKATFFYYDSRSQEPEVNELAEKFNLNYTSYKVAVRVLVKEIKAKVVIETRNGSIYKYNYTDIDDLEDIYAKDGWSFK